LKVQPLCVLADVKIAERRNFMKNNNRAITPKRLFNHDKYIAKGLDKPEYGFVHPKLLSDEQLESGYEYALAGMDGAIWDIQCHIAALELDNQQLRQQLADTEFRRGNLEKYIKDFWNSLPEGTCVLQMNEEIENNAELS